MIYATRLEAGDWYVCTTTNAPNCEVFAVHALPTTVFADGADARQAARIAADWADRNLWEIRATDRETGKEFACFTWIRDPRDGITRAMMDAREFGRDCYGFRAVPA